MGITTQENTHRTTRVSAQQLQAKISHFFLIFIPGYFPNFLSGSVLYLKGPWVFSSTSVTVDGQSRSVGESPPVTMMAPWEGLSPSAQNIDT